jgi:hypothetical protein
MLSVASGAARACVCFLALALAPAAQAGWRWLNPTVQGNPVSVLLHDGGRYLAMDARGGVLASSNATDWQLLRDNTPGDSVNDAVQRNGAIVAVGNRGSVLFSADGAHWQNISTPTTADLYAVTAGPAGFVATGRLTLLHSADGVNWNLIDTGVQPGIFGPSFQRVRYGAGRYVVWVDQDFFGFAAPFETLSSTDGVNWTRTPVPLPAPLDSAPLYLRTLDYIDGRFVAGATNVGGLSASLVSTDGLAWSAGTQPVFNTAFAYFRGIAFDAASQRYIGLTDVNDPPMPQPSYPLFFRSGDGLDWSDGQLVDRVPLTGLATVNSRVFGFCPPGGAIYERLPDASWQARRPLPPAWALLDVLAEGNTLVAVGNGPSRAVEPPYVFNDIVPALLWSQDNGASWSSMTFDASVLGGSLGAVAAGGGALVAVGAEQTAAGAYPVIYVSRNGGQAWTRAALAPEEDVSSFSDIAYAGGRFVVTATTSAKRKVVYTSDDGGDTWQLHETGQSDGFYRIAAAGNGFVAAIDFGDSVYRSADGVTWTAASTGSGAQSITAVAAHAGRYLAATSTFTSAGSVVQLYTSDDGANWQLSPTAPAGINRLETGTGGFIALTADGKVATSADGMDWATAWSGATQRLMAAARQPGGDIVVVTGNGGILSGSVDQLFADGFD